MDECNHKFCVECLEDNFEYAIKNGNTKDIGCPRKECKHKVGFFEIKQVIKSPIIFEKYEKFLLETALVKKKYFLFFIFYFLFYFIFYFLFLFFIFYFLFLFLFLFLYFIFRLVIQIVVFVLVQVVELQ